MREYESKKEDILFTLKEKSTVKQTVYNNVSKIFGDVKDVLQDIDGFFMKKIPKRDDNLAIYYRDRGEFEAKIKLAGDVLIFNMHSNVFYFDRNHAIWKNSYVKEDKTRAYCGMINIYNFLADSFKYNRIYDIGYLVARVFVNKENHYFVEGKKEVGFLYNDFGNAVIDKKAVTSIVESSILYCLNFDLLTPPYDSVKELTVEEMERSINNMKFRTGKRLGFKFQADPAE